MVRTSLFIPLNKIGIHFRVGSDTDQPAQRSYSSRTAASARRPNAAPPYNKGSSGFSQGAYGERSDTGRSSSKFQTTLGSPPHTNAHVPASRTYTALVPSKNSTYYVPHGVANHPSNPPSPPPPKPPKPDELKKEMSTDMVPPLTRRNPDPNREGSYSHPPPSLSMDRVTTGAGGYPSPCFPEPEFPASHNATQGFGYPSPTFFPQVKGPHRREGPPFSKGKLNHHNSLLRYRRVC